MEILRKLRVAAALVTWRDLRARPAACPLCGPSVIVQLQASALGVRCLRCSASAITMSHVSVLRAEVGNLGGLHVYELSARGSLVEWLRRHAGKLTCSEYLDGVPAGETVGGVQCQDVRRLTYAAGSFDICTSTEVFEHVSEDAPGFAELHRVLRPGGRLIFSVPMSGREKTMERARLKSGKIEHLLPPEYHGDRIRGRERVLAYRNYGLDILDRVRAAGFSDARLVTPHDRVGRWAQPIVVATA
jgi:SAM-dependent methyltransferase